MKWLVEHPLFHEPVEIERALSIVASKEGHDEPDDDLIAEAARCIRILKTLNRILLQQLKAENEQQLLWRILSDNLRDIDPEFVRIVEDNFFELLA